MIKVLDKTVADKIAAGEVIERPVSIVKELVENAIDSGGDSVVVEIKNGGKSYIRVTDNGCGIPADQVETAFLRHATSKIETAKDLDAILTLGFRGEALASIAAVTHTELITKTKDAKMGTKVLIHGSEVLSNSGTGCPDGTTIVVTDLFYNTPARQKFLKSDAAESGQIIDLMSQIALAYPNIKFRFINNGNIMFSTLGNGDVKAAILAVYKMKEYQDLVPVDYSNGKAKVTGYISRPSLSRTNRRNQIFFVNGRVVSSKVIDRGVTLGYKERLFDGRYPVCFLFIETDPGCLDVNIHPNKREVRFDQEEEIVQLVGNAIKTALGTKAAIVEAKNIFREESTQEEKASTKSQEQVDIKSILSTKRPAPILRPERK
ncbi:MAG: DNA mismatch repair endonuclease MutL, partial [Firmicutes bacterium]|nr:DNA mismatch repair endonuclease MutL [Bacillota bacterium]